MEQISLGIDISKNCLTAEVAQGSRREDRDASLLQVAGCRASELGVIGN